MSEEDARRSALEMTEDELEKLSWREMLVAGEITSVNKAGNYVLDTRKLVRYLAKQRVKQRGEEGGEDK